MEEKQKKPKDVLILNHGISQTEAAKLLRSVRPTARDAKTQALPTDFSILSDPNNFNITFQHRIQGIANAAEFWIDCLVQQKKITLATAGIAKACIKKNKDASTEKIQSLEKFDDYQTTLYEFYEALVAELQTITKTEPKAIKKELQQAEKYEGLRPRPSITTISRIPLGRKAKIDDAKTNPPGRKPSMEEEDVDIVYGYLIQTARPARALSLSDKSDYLNIFLAAVSSGIPQSSIPDWFKKAKETDRISLIAALKALFATPTQERLSVSQMLERLDSIFFQSGVRIGPGVANFFICETEVVTQDGVSLTTPSRLPQLRSAIFSSPHAEGDVQTKISDQNLLRIATVAVEQHLTKKTDSGTSGEITIPLYLRTLVTPTQLSLVTKFSRYPMSDYRVFKAKQQAIKDFTDKNPHSIDIETQDAFGRTTKKTYKVRFDVVAVNHIYNDRGRTTMTGRGRSFSIEQGGEKLITLAEKHCKKLAKVLPTTPENQLAMTALQTAVAYYKSVRVELDARGNYGADGHLKLCSAESRLADLLGIMIWDACVEGKDRTTVAKVNEDARMVREARAEYARRHRDIIPIDASAAEDYAAVYATGHHRKLTGQHGTGVDGSKKPNAYLPPEYVSELDRQLGADFVHQSATVAETFNQEVIVLPKKVKDRRKSVDSSQSSLSQTSLPEDDNDLEDDPTSTLPHSRSSSELGRRSMFGKTHSAGLLTRAFSDLNSESSPDTSKMFFRQTSSADDDPLSTPILSASETQASPALYPNGVSAGSTGSSTGSLAAISELISPPPLSLSSDSAHTILRELKERSKPAPIKEKDWPVIHEDSFVIPDAEFSKSPENEQDIVGEFLRNFVVAGRKPSQFKNPPSPADLAFVVKTLSESYDSFDLFVKAFVSGTGIYAKLQSSFLKLLPLLSPALTAATSAPFTAQLQEHNVLIFSQTIRARIPDSSPGEPNIVYHTECSVTKGESGTFKASPMKVTFQINDNDENLYEGLDQALLFKGLDKAKKREVLKAHAAEAIRSATADFSPEAAASFGALKSPFSKITLGELFNLKRRTGEKVTGGTASPEELRKIKDDIKKHTEAGKTILINIGKRIFSPRYGAIDTANTPEIAELRGVFHDLEVATLREMDVAEKLQALNTILIKHQIIGVDPKSREVHSYVNTGLEHCRQKAPSRSRTASMSNLGNSLMWPGRRTRAASTDTPPEALTRTESPPR